MEDRLEMTYKAVEQIIACHGLPRPEQFGGGKWNAKEEFEVYKKQVGDRYTALQWRIIEKYFNELFEEKVKHE